jgi:EpsI family protein
MTAKNSILFVLLVATSLVAYVLTPTQILNPPLSKPLEELTPRSFGDWHELKTNNVQVDLVPRKDGQPNKFGPYDDSLLRSYQNSKGDVVMLALAYGRTQRQEVKIHRPELCYVAQGFFAKRLTETNFGRFGTSSTEISGKNMIAETPGRVEAVSYWIRIGDEYSKNAWQTRLHILKMGLSGNVPDGILVRVSTLLSNEGNAQNAWELNKKFMQDLVINSNIELNRLLVR